MPKVLVHVDYKSGRWSPGPAETSLQLWAGAFALAARFKCDAVRIGYYFCRDAAFEWYPSKDGYVMLDSEEADSMREAVKASALLDGTPNVGDHCSPCFDKKRCSAYQDSLTK
jgi:hypothetical protein